MGCTSSICCCCSKAYALSPGKLPYAPYPPPDDFESRSSSLDTNELFDLLFHPPAEFRVQQQPEPKSTPSVKTENSSTEPRLPIPNDLINAQREYAARGETPEIDPSTGIPKPFPPPTTKEEIFKPEDYEFVDKRAGSVPGYISCGPVQALVDYLIQGTNEDIGRVRAFYVWIAVTTYGGFTPTDDTDLDNAYNKLVLARQKKYYYAALFCDMCRCAGIPCEMIRGCCKSFRTDDSTNFEEGNYCWCAVYVEDAWRFIDANFGSGFKVGGKHDWKIVDSDFANLKTSKEQGEERKIFQINETYFLTDPELFIYNHFPMESEWQLLARPVTKDEFSMMAQVSPEYFKWNLSDMSEPRGHFSTNTGDVEMTFVPNPDVPIKFNYVLYKFTETELSQDPSKHMSQLVRLENRNNEKLFQVYFKEIGLYKLVICVPKKDGQPENKTGLVTYFIRCNCPYFQEVDNPCLPDELQELGPGADWKSMGINSKVSGGIIHAHHGCAKLPLSDDGEIDYLFKLLPLDSLEDDSKDFTCGTLADKHQHGVNLYMKLPSHGKFLLQVYTRTIGEASHTHSSNFIITSEMKCSAEPFPLSLNKSVGNIGNPRLLVPISTPHSYLAIEEVTDELTLEFTVQQERFFMIKLIHLRDGIEADLTQFTWFEKVGDLLRCHLRFPKHGVYIFTIFAKEKESMPIYNNTWQYLLEVEKPTNCLPFPNKAPGWKEDMVLVNPSVRNLATDSVYELKVTVPQSSRVYAIKNGENVTTELQRNSNEEWKANVSSLRQTKHFEVYAEFPGVGKAQQLLWYEVSEDSTFDEKSIEYKDEVQRASYKQLQLKTLRDQEDSKAKQRAKEASDKSSAAKKEFERRKNELFAKEAELEKKAMEVRFKRTLMETDVTCDAVMSLQRILTDTDVRAVVLALMIMLGHSEDKLAKPEDCQKLIRAIGAESIVQQMMQLDILAVQRSVITRATELLQGVDLYALRENRPIAALACDWVRGCLNFHAALEAVGQ